MRGITEERLREVQAEWMDKYGIKESMIIDHLIDTECRELNPWLPIDENTSKDRRLLLKANCGVAVEGSFNDWHWEEHLLHTEIRPTHYQELPGDPET